MTICRTSESYRCRIRSVGCAVTISEADHEARGISEIVSKGRPQRCARRNRIARATKLGAALPHARRQSCDAASSACNMGNGLAECLARISEIVTQLGVVSATFGGCSESRLAPRPYRSVGLPCASTVRLPRAWRENRLI